MAAFVQRGQSKFFRSPADRRPLELRDAFYAFARLVKQAANSWRERLAAVNVEAIQAILERVPAQRMSAPSKRFTLELLLANQRRLLELELE
jgi:hypothetical protein